jgi:hypothetical protein
MSRAAEMARIMMEAEWPENQTAESFALRHFAKDSLADLEQAIKIMAELERADDIATEWFERPS